MLVSRHVCDFRGQTRCGFLKLLEDPVDQTTSKRDNFSETGANCSERFTPYAMKLFEEEKLKSKECVSLSFIKMLLVDGVLCE